MSDQERDPIVMAADAAKAFCIRRLRRAIREAKRLHAMPLTADECVTILENSNWEEELPQSSTPASQDATR